MRPGQGAGSGIWGKANLGANIGLWALAGDVTNYNNVLGPSSRQNIMNRLGTQTNIADRLGTKQNIANRLGPQQNMGKNQRWSQPQNAVQKLSSKIKRLNQENKPRFNAFNPNANKNKGKAVNKSSKTIEDKKCEDDLPTEALFCYMCDLGGFGSISDYISHLEADSHDIMAKAYKSICTANLELFRAEAKIISHRVIVKDLKKIQGETQYCQKCQCQVVGGLATHEKSSEHLHVSNYLGIRCCGTSFNSRTELEEHWLSLQHIQFRSKMFSKYKDHGLSLQNEEENRQKLSAKATVEPHYDVSTWPAFDPTVPVGLKYVDIGASNKCSVCCDYLEPMSIVILNHCCSSKHYQNMCIFFKKLGNKIQILGVKTELETQNKNQTQAKVKIIFNSRENSVLDKSVKVKAIPSNETATQNETQTKDESIQDSTKSLVQKKSVKVKEIPIKVESVLERTEPSDSSNTEDKSESKAISDGSKIKIPQVSTAEENEAELVDDYGTVLEPPILLDESKNESILEVKSDADNRELKNEDKNGAEELKVDIAEKEQEKHISEKVQEDISEKEQEDISPEQESKDVPNTDKEQDDTSAKLENEDSVNDIDIKEQEQNITEQQSSAELSSSSSSLSNKLFVIAEEECDECENGSGECKKHVDKMGSPKRKNSEEIMVELGTPKKLRTEEPAVATPTRRSRRRSMSEEPTISTPTRSRRKSITEEPKVSTPSRTSTRRKSITQL